jgi:hypothetical protein
VYGPSVTVRRAMLIVASLCIALEVAHAAPSVAVDLSTLDSDVADAAALEQALVMRLLQEGFAIDPLTAEPSIVVAVSGGEPELVLSAKSAHFERARTIDVTGSGGAQLQLEIVQKVVELARLAREAAPPPSPPAPAVASPPAVAAAPASRAQHDLPAQVSERGEAREQPPRWEIGGDVGVVSTGTAEASVHARYAIGARVGAVLRAAASQPDEAAISVGEQELMAGASYEWTLASRLVLDVGALAGVHRHHFELSMQLADRTGTRYDPVLATPVRLSLQASRRFEVSVWGIGKLAKEREHVSGTEVLWRRDVVTAGAGVGVAARF